MDRICFCMDLVVLALFLLWLGSVRVRCLAVSQLYNSIFHLVVGVF